MMGDPSVLHSVKFQTGSKDIFGLGSGSTNGVMRLYHGPTRSVNNATPSRQGFYYRIFDGQVATAHTGGFGSTLAATTFLTDEGCTLL